MKDGKKKGKKIYLWYMWILKVNKIKEKKKEDIDRGKERFGKKINQNMNKKKYKEKTREKPVNKLNTKKQKEEIHKRRKKINEEKERKRGVFLFSNYSELDPWFSSPIFRFFGSLPQLFRFFFFCYDLGHRK